MYGHVYDDHRILVRQVQIGYGDGDSAAYAEWNGIRSLILELFAMGVHVAVTGLLPTR